MGMRNWRVLMLADSTLEKYPHNPQKPHQKVNIENIEDIEDVAGEFNPPNCHGKTTIQKHWVQPSCAAASAWQKDGQKWKSFQNT